MARRIREEIIDDEVTMARPAPVRRRVVSTRFSGGAYRAAMNPLGIGISVVLAVFILVLVFGYLL